VREERGMTLAEVKKILDAEVIVGEDMLNMQVERGFAADLMSDVLAFAKEGSMLLTDSRIPLWSARQTRWTSRSSSSCGANAPLLMP